jgi:uncharacterized protein (DUF2147 family)
LAKSCSDVRHSFQRIKCPNKKAIAASLFCRFPLLDPILGREDEKRVNSMLPRNPLFRRHQWSLLTALAAAAVATQPSFAAEPGVPPLGTWINHSGKGGIETYMCGKYLCGRVVWLREPLTSSGKPMYDGRNPDPKKRERLICGLTTILNLKPMTDGSWGDGQAYNPEEGKSYDVSVKLASPDELEVTGSVLFFSKTVQWKKAPPDLPRCDVALQNPTAPAPTQAAKPPAAAPATPTVPATVKAVPTKPSAPAADAKPATLTAPAKPSPAAASNSSAATPAAAAKSATKPTSTTTKPTATTAPAPATSAKPANVKTAVPAAPAAAKAVTPAPAQKTTTPTAAAKTTAAPTNVPKPVAATPPAKKPASTTAQPGTPTAAPATASSKKSQPAAAAEKTVPAAETAPGAAAPAATN